MPRIACFCIAFFFCASALAQSYSGTYSAKNNQGGTVTLAIKQDAKGNATGTLSGNNTTFQVKATVNAEGLYGTVVSASGTLLIAAQLEGASQLKVVLAEPLPNGQPNMAAARRLVMARSGGGAPGKGGTGAAATRVQAAPGPGPGQAQAQAGQDGQISVFLMGNAWCGFTYNKTTGASRSERVVFHGNGLITQGSNAETYSSGAGGTVAGQSRGGNQGRWKVQNSMLLLSQDGVNWEPQQVQVTRNSNGSPILKSGGKEYMVCR